MAVGVGAPTATDRLVDLVVSTRVSDLPPQAMHCGRSVLIDTVGAAIGGSGTGLAAPVLDTVLPESARGPATVLSGRLDTNAGVLAATYVNAHLANILDSDETILNRSHYAAAVVPAALAAAQSAGRSGADLLAAIVLGYEVSARVGIAMPHFQHSETGEFTHTLTGYSSSAFGAAAAAGRLLGLDAVAMASAFGIVGKSAPVHFSWSAGAGLRGYFSDQEPTGFHKYAMFGAIAESGVRAALLAGNGYRGAAGVFDRSGELHRSFGAPGLTESVMAGSSGATWWIERAALKAWPSCRFGHPALTALCSMRADLDDLDDIEEIRVTIPPFAFLEQMARFSLPDVPEKLVFSLPMALALLASGVEPGPQWWAPENFMSLSVRSLAARVTCVVDAERAEVLRRDLEEYGGYVRIPTTVEVRTARRTLTAHSDYSLGDVLGVDLALAPAVIRSKFLAHTNPALGPAASELHARLMAIPEIPDCAMLFDGLDTA